MPFFPEPKDADINQNPEESLPDFGYWDLFKESLKAGALDIITKSNINAIPIDYNKYNPKYSVSAELRNDLMKPRPGLNIPVGASEFIARSLANNYDEQQYYNVVYNHKPGLLGKATAFAGASGAGLLDLKSDIAGAFAGGLAIKAFKPVAGRLLSKLASSELFGWNAGHIATVTAENAVGGAAGVTGYTLSSEKEQYNYDENLGNPHNYIQSLQNIAMAPVFGAGLGLTFGTLGMALFGRKVPMPDGSTRRVGGIFNDTSFRDVPPEAKDLINKHYRPWSQDADNIMKEEVGGQMANGNFPNLDPILKQGIYDQGEKFRNVLKDANIDTDHLLTALEKTDESLSNRIKEIVDIGKTIDEHDERFIKEASELDKESTHLSQQHITDLLLQSENRYKLSDTIPENVRRYIDKQNKIDELKAKIEGEPTLSQAQKLEKLEQSKPNLLSIKDELTDLHRKLTKDQNFESNPRFKRLTELAKVYQPAKTILDRLNLEKNHNDLISDLATEKMVIANMRGQILNTHPQATPDDVKAYADHVRSSGIPASEVKIPDVKDVTTEKYIDDVINNDMANLIKDMPEELRQEYDEIKRGIENLPTFDEMVKQMTECVVKGIL